MTCLRVTVFVFVAVATSCNRNPTPTTPSATRGDLRALHVTGPTIVAPGETVRYTATAEYFDRTSEDVTQQVEWLPVQKPDMVLYFTAKGVAVGDHAGDVDVRAIYGGKVVGTLPVVVLVPGTSRIGGAVTEVDSGVVPGAAVEVVMGSGLGLRTTADYLGRYALYGMSGIVRLRASAEGFESQTDDVAVTSRDVTYTFALAPAQRPATVAGMWIMTIAPSPTCRSGLPDHVARGRSYHLEIIQRGTQIQTTITGPTVEVRNSQAHKGTIVGSRLSLFFAGDTGYGEWTSSDIDDHVSDNELFGFSGTAKANASGASEIRGTMNGDLNYRQLPAATYAPTWYCRAADHIVTLRR